MKWKHEIMAKNLDKLLCGKKLVRSVTYLSSANIVLDIHFSDTHTLFHHYFYSDGEVYLINPWKVGKGVIVNIIPIDRLHGQGYYIWPRIKGIIDFDMEDWIDRLRNYEVER